MFITITATENARCSRPSPAFVSACPPTSPGPSTSAAVTSFVTKAWDPRAPTSWGVLISGAASFFPSSPLTIS